MNTTTRTKRAVITVIRRPRCINGVMIPLRIEERKVRVVRATRATVKEIISK